MVSIDIYNKDCMDVLKGIGDNSVDLVVTSPPYNKAGLNKNAKEGSHRWNATINYDKYSDTMDEDEYESWQVDVLNEIYRILKPTGSLFYNHKVRRAYKQSYFPSFVFNSKLKFYQMIVWDRSICVDINSGYLFPTTELIFWFCKDVPKVNKNNAEFKSEVWKILPSKNDIHPASFPYRLVKNCIDLCTDVGDLVVDPFSGGGTTAVVCKDTNRNFIGAEISENYYNLSLERVNNSNGSANIILTGETNVNKTSLF